MTCCKNDSCPFDDCERSYKNYGGNIDDMFVTNFFSTCDRYMKYLAEKINGNTEKT